MFPSFVGLGVFLLSLATTVVASPFQLSRRDIPSQLLNDFTLFSRFAALATCDQNNNGSRLGHTLTCDQEPCDLVQKDDTVIIDSFHNSENATGYIALDNTRQLIVVVFRGTVSKGDQIADLSATFTDATELCPNCRAHKGFWRYWQSAKDRVTNQVDNLTQSNPDYRIMVVGHSLGGAVATLAGAALRAKFKLDIWTYGSPKIGNKALAEFITNQTSTSHVGVYRATHSNDVVPALPDILWSNPSPEYWTTVANGEPVTTNGVTVIEGINNRSGVLSTNIYHGIDASHGWYFGNMTICATPVDTPPEEN